MTRLGNFLFRHRATIGIAGFILTFAFSHPSPRSLLIGLIPTAPGLVLRLWAAGYIGTAGRVKDIGVQALITTGPYRYVKHPLYVGNFLLVLGVLIALRPLWWLAVVIIALFVIEYTVIARAESRRIATTIGSNPAVESRPNSSPLTSPLAPGLSPLGFEWLRARNEWITLALLGLVYLLALLRLQFRH